MVFRIKSSSKKEKNDDTFECDLNEPADFETAITATGFGWFNILLLLVGCPAAIASVFETAVVSYVLPSAECDLGLDLLNKGVLNAVTYSGQKKIVGMLESKCSLSYLLRNYGFLPVEEFKPEQPLPELVMKSCNGIIICLKSRN